MSRAVRSVVILLLIVDKITQHNTSYSTFTIISIISIILISIILLLLIINTNNNSSNCNISERNCVTR